MTIDIAVSEFVKRQTPESEFTHFDGGWAKLVHMVQATFSQAKPGYRDGVVLVPVPPGRFLTGIVQLQEGDKLVGDYKARKAGEEPRKTTRVVSYAGKQPCKGVDVVLYRHDVLVETGEASCDAEWEIISVNGRISEEDQPIAPGTLMANHFELDGGTATGLSDSEFVAKLRESVLYWKDKAMMWDPSCSVESSSDAHEKWRFNLRKHIKAAEARAAKRPSWQRLYPADYKKKE